jgi:hypothetical protein
VCREVELQCGYEIIIQYSRAVLAQELTPEDGRPRPKHVAREKGEYIYEIDLHCDGSSDTVPKNVNRVTSDSNLSPLQINCIVRKNFFLQPSFCQY